MANEVIYIIFGISRGTSRVEDQSPKRRTFGTGKGIHMRREDLPGPREGFVLTHYLTTGDVERSRAFYRDVLGGRVVFEGGPCMVKLANSWVIINEGGGPTPDKPDVTLAPPSDPTTASSFLNIRVADIEACYAEWSAKGAEFLTPPVDLGPEIRCYMRDPDGYLIEVGQATRLPEE